MSNEREDSEHDTMCVSRRGERRGAHSSSGNLKECEGGRQDVGGLRRGELEFSATVEAIVQCSELEVKGQHCIPTGRRKLGRSVLSLCA